MKAGIMQPYFFPYIGYFSLIKQTDIWISFDQIQYIRRGWVNRNRIIHPNKDEDLYIAIPVQKHDRDTLICNVKINRSESYIEKISGQLIASYKKRAPFFEPVYNLVMKVLSYPTEYLAELNHYALQQVCNYLNISVDFHIFSQMKLEIDPVLNAGEWALNICKAIGADGYYNPTGGMSLFDQNKFSDNGIELWFLEPDLTPYNQKKSSFIPGLSILDVMMFNDNQTVHKMLDSFTLLEKQREE